MRSPDPTLCHVDRHDIGAQLDLERALPAPLVGNTHGWLTQYRRYPVYGRAWTRLRWRPASILGGLFYLLVVVAVVMTSGDARTLGGLLLLAAQMGLALALGPAAAGWVRRQGWPMVREGACLAAVLCSVAVGTTVLVWAFGEPIKQAVAHATGSVDSQGRRLPYRLSIGVAIKSGQGDGQPTDTAQPDPPDDPLVPFVSVSTATQTLLILWLAGGFALFSWRRELLGLQRLRQEQALQRAQSERREAEMKLSVLAAQVEPHFLFNTLAGVRSAIGIDPARASDMIDRLVDYLRASIPRLREDGSLQATVGAQTEIVRSYLALMRARMPRLDYSVDVPAQLAQSHCPPLMLISMAENAVKHGVEPKIGPAEVRLVVRSPAPGRLRLAILDDGVGFGESGTGSGLGLTNIRARLAELYGSGATLTLLARPGGGVEAAIELPLEASQTP